MLLDEKGAEVETSVGPYNVGGTLILTCDILGGEKINMNCLFLPENCFEYKNFKKHVKAQFIILNPGHKIDVSQISKYSPINKFYDFKIQKLCT